MIRTGCRNSLTVAAATLLASAAIAGCGAQTTDSKGGVDGTVKKIGQIGAELVLGPGINVNRVDWSLSNSSPPAGFMSPRTGFFDVTGPGETFTGLITGVPAAPGYDLTFSAESVDHAYVCTGHAMPSPFAVIGGQTVLQSVHMTCNNTAGRTGNVLVNGAINACPTADNVMASSLSAAVGSTITLTGTGTDPDMAPNALTYHFALSTMQPSPAGMGTITNPNQSVATFRCDAPGSVSVDLSVSDGDAACGPTSYQAIVICTGVDACAGLPACTASDQCHLVGQCDHTSGMCTNPTANNGTTCSDGNPNTVGESCQAGVCGGGVDHCVGVTCAAAGQCQTGAGTCDHSTGVCSYTNAANGTACDDGNPATSGDSCQGGVCGGANLCAGVTCNTPGSCRVSPGTCSPATGTCSYATAADGATCDDGNASTTGDHCTGGMCAGTVQVNQCMACETMAHGTNNNCVNNYARCTGLTGNTSATSPIMPNVPKAQLCIDIVNCVHGSATHCADPNGNGDSDCICGIGVDPTSCFNGTFAAMTGDCRDLMAAGAESNNPATINANYFATSFALGAAMNFVQTCDELFCATQCL